MQKGDLARVLALWRDYLKHIFQIWLLILPNPDENVSVARSNQEFVFLFWIHARKSCQLKDLVCTKPVRPLFIQCLCLERQTLDDVVIACRDDWFSVTNADVNNRLVGVSIFFLDKSIRPVDEIHLALRGAYSDACPKRAEADGTHLFVFVGVVSQV